MFNLRGYVDTLRNQWRIQDFEKGVSATQGTIFSSSSLLTRMLAKSTSETILVYQHARLQTDDPRHYFRQPGPTPFSKGGFSEPMEPPLDPAPENLPDGERLPSNLSVGSGFQSGAGVKACRLSDARSRNIVAKLYVKDDIMVHNYCVYINILLQLK